MILTKHTRTTQDLNGCEFEYTCYSSKEYRWEKASHYYIVYDRSGKRIAEDKTLTNLKIKMSQL